MITFFFFDRKCSTSNPSFARIVRKWTDFVNRKRELRAPHSRNHKFDARADQKAAQAGRPAQMTAAQAFLPSRVGRDLPTALNLHFA
jgi:hypothetical protein